jgi:copper(I)-binding protein
VPALAVAVSLGLTGCGAGLKAQTYQERTVADATNEAVGALALRNVFIQPPRTSEGVYSVGQDARVVLTLVNEGTEGDRLVNATTDAASSVAVAAPDGQAGQLSVGPLSTTNDYSLVLRGLTRDLRPGEFVNLSLTFQANGTQELLVPVALTGTPGPKREGYHVVETDSEGNPLPEREESHSEQEGASDRPELDTDGGDAPSGDAVIDEGSEPVGDNNGGASGATPPPEG